MSRFFPRYFLLLALSLLICSISFAQKKEKKKKKKEEQEKLVDKKGLSENDRLQLNYYFYSAIREKTLKNYQDAATFFRKCIELDPTNDGAYYELALLYQSSGQLDEALKMCKKALDISPEEEWYNKLEAQLLEEKQQYKEAASIYQKLIDKHPENLDYYFDYASMLLYTGKLDEAIKIYDQVQNKTGINEEMSMQKQKIYIKLGKIDKAVEEIKNLINSKPDEARYYLLLAELYSANNMQEEAFMIYQELLTIDQDNGYVRLALADYYRIKGDEVNAFEQLKLAFENKGIDIDTKVRILYPYFSMLQNQDIKAKALVLSKLIVNVHPQEAKAHSIYGDFLLQDSLDLQAREEYRKAIELDKKIYALWDQLIRLDLSLNDYQAAWKESNEALTYFPNQTILFLYNGIAANQLEKYSEAVDMLKNGIAIGSDNNALMAQLFSALGDSYHSLKKDTEAYASYDKSLELLPDQQYVLNNYSYYLSLSSNDLNKAAEMSLKSNKLEPDNSSFEDTYAWILYKMGRYEEAKVWIEKAIKNGGDKSATILEHYGDILYKLGQSELALNNWKKAKENGSKSNLLDKKIIQRKLYE